MDQSSAMMQQVDITKVYTSERENLELVQHNWIGEGLEGRLLHKTQKKEN